MEEQIQFDQLETEYSRLSANAAGLEYEQENEEKEENDDQYTEQPFDADKIRIDQQMLSIKYMLELMDEKFN